MLRTLVLTLVVMLASPVAEGAEARPYSDEAFAALQAEGSPILVDVYATWCPTCRRQGQILEPLLAEPEFAGLIVLKLDWDAQRDAARALGAPRQSTLIVFRGDEERGRSIADTSEAGIRGLLERAVAD
ncbi:MAG: thioredoxin family protein [Xanthomonadaceae bacterium]|nr:thioredoxin family protein [Xanthomonadaceae bacterium]